MDIQTVTVYETREEWLEGRKGGLGASKNGGADDAPV